MKIVLVSFVQISTSEMFASTTVQWRKTTFKIINSGTTLNKRSLSYYLTL